MCNIRFIFICLFFIFLLFAKKNSAQEPINYSTKNGLPTNHVYDILQDHEGFMWFATNRGLLKYDGYRFNHFTHKNGLPNNDTWKLCNDAKNRLWFFSKSNYQGYVEKDTIYTFKTYNNKTISPVSNFAYPDGLVIGNDQTNKFVNNKFVENKTIINHNLKNKISGEYNLIDIPFNKNIIALKNGFVDIYNYDFERIKSFEVAYLKIKNPFNIDYFSNQIIAIYENNTVILMDLKNYNFTSFDYATLGIEPGETVQLKFHNQHIQLSSRGKLILLNTSFDITKKYNFPTIDNIGAFQDNQGNVWLNTSNKGIYLFTKHQLESKYFLEGIKTNVTGKYNHHLIAATESKGTFVLNPEKENVELLPNFSILSQDTPYRIVHDDTGEYLVKQKSIYKGNERIKYEVDYSNTTTSYSGGKDILNVDGQRYIIASHQLYSSVESIGNVFGLKEIEKWNDTIYIGGSNGLSMLLDNKIVPYAVQDSLLNFSITRLVSGHNNLWIGSDGRGVFYLDRNGAHQIKSTENLSITEILQKDDILWLATNNGVKKISITSPIYNSKITDAFYVNDGLLQNNTNSIHLQDSILWIATDTGISSLSIAENRFKQKIKLYFQHQRDSIEILSNQSRNFEVHFGAINFAYQDKLKFKYKLFPIDTHWKQTTGKSISFNQLKPGKYTLQIMAEDHHHNVGNEEIKIIVHPKWWESTWIFICLLILGILLLAGIIWAISRYFHQRKIKRIEQNRRVKELELQALRSQMNPHFVHNSLNAIQYYIQLNDVDKSEEYLTKFSELIRFFFEYSREKHITLQKEIKMIRHYLEIEVMRFEEKISYQIDIDPTLNPSEKLIPTMILQPLVENAINHGLFHKKENGNILIQFKNINENTFTVLIKDDGIGIDKAKEIYNKSAKKYRSHSGMVLEERLRLLKETKAWIIDYQITSNSNPPKTGTTITLKFTQNPLHANNRYSRR